MLACHFFLPISRNFLANFFRNSKKVICLCDPPFGIHVAALMRTINSLREMFYAASNNKYVKPFTNQINFFSSSMAFNSIIFLPYFIGKHLDNQYSLSMVDFKVVFPIFWLLDLISYSGPSGHLFQSSRLFPIAKDCGKFFGILFKLILLPKVRMFTDLPGRSFKLPEEKGYHFCEECDRFVAEANRHCWKCGECTSKVNNCSQSEKDNDNRFLVITQINYKIFRMALLTHTVTNAKGLNLLWIILFIPF